MNKKPVLAGLSLNELTALLGDYPAYRAKQVFKWICAGCSSFNEMTNLPEKLRNELAENYRLYPGKPCAELTDNDGTVKYAIELEDGAIIEAVLLVDGEDRSTACISTQAGCPISCVFCKTGSLGFRRNLNMYEILYQFLLLKEKRQGISNIVIMGMGEPLLNLDELRKALAFITDKDGLNFSKRRITLSTSGIISGINSLAVEGPDIRLALSLISANEKLREKLIPAARENPLPLIKESLLKYQEKTGHRITLEIVLLGSINSSHSEAEAVKKFSRGLQTIINIIPWNPVPGLLLEGHPIIPPTTIEINDFMSALSLMGLNVTLRTGKGLGVSGACGQLGHS